MWLYDYIEISIGFFAGHGSDFLTKSPLFTRVHQQLTDFYLLH